MAVMRLLLSSHIMAILLKNAFDELVECQLKQFVRNTITPWMLNRSKRIFYHYPTISNHISF